MKGTKGSETKALIRETAFKQFLTKDYSMVPLKDIEKSLNLSRGCTSYHYPTKQELFSIRGLKSGYWSLQSVLE